MLKGIAGVISPELLKILMEMGHGDELVIADGNFPSAGTARRLVRSDGNTAVDLLEAILPLFPLDTFVESPLTLMSVVPGHDYDPVIWKTFREIVGRHAPDTAFAFVERFAFYEQARQAYAIVATSETALYANIILKKGVIPA